MIFVAHEPGVAGRVVCFEFRTGFNKSLTSLKMTENLKTPCCFFEKPFHEGLDFFHVSFCKNCDTHNLVLKGKSLIQQWPQWWFVYCHMHAVVALNYMAKRPSERLQGDSDRRGLIAES